ncbi:MAG TPA: hypothetical protein VKA85_05710 [Candidatus Limnocylindrales bacterium]|nr:hypothetical protein [Candidatus Limnocylindrales bacterium]
MTDLDPHGSDRAKQPGSDLVERAGRERPPHRDDELHGEMTGPTGRAPATERKGDPDRAGVDSAAHTGAASGAIAGTAVAGPFGAIPGAVIGAAAGAGAEAVDEEGGTNEAGALKRSGSDGTGPIDPATGYGQETGR